MKTQNKIRLFFLARSLDAGGTERQLVALAKSLDKNIFDVTICLFYGQGQLINDLSGHDDVRLVSLDKKSRWDVFGFGARLTQLLVKQRPHVVYTMGPVPNIIGLACARACSRAKVVWGIRASRMETPKNDFLPKTAYFLELRLSKYCDLVIANSNAGKYDIIRRGFLADKIKVVHNGIDTAWFAFSEKGKKQMRKTWGVAPAHLLIGLVANIRPVKDNAAFLEAGAVLCQTQKNIRLVCVGAGNNVELKKLAKALGIESRVIWAGHCDDMAEAYSAMDILCSTSLAEGFSNVIAEAMSCGVPAVVTNVGDSALIVGQAGLVVEPKNPRALANALNTMISQIANEPDLCQKARLRIKENFSSTMLAARTQQAIESILHKNVICF